MSHSPARKASRTGEKKSSVQSRTRRRPDFYDPSEGKEPFGLSEIAPRSVPWEPARTNCFSIYLVQSGSGVFYVDAAEHPYAESQLLCFQPYQFVRFVPSAPTALSLMTFHANFLCVETFHSETGCSGVLFNNVYGIPVVKLNVESRLEIDQLLERLRHELKTRQLASQEAILATLKLLLIIASRLKAAQCQPQISGGVDLRDPVLSALKELIEQNYRSLHAPSEYAALMHMTTKTLGRHVRQTLGKTLTDLIRERVLTHAKWQLLHTLRPVKEVANEVGFQDELYFSRLFKKATGVSPTYFREFETRIRDGRNLSIPFG